MAQGQRGGQGWPDQPGRPGGGVYEWYRRGMRLLEGGNAAAAAQLLEYAAAEEPESRSVREALARAQFDSGQYGQAAESFRRIVESHPSDDYAQFGLGLALIRTGELDRAVEHLALAVAMRPETRHYAAALRRARASRRARE